MIRPRHVVFCYLSILLLQPIWHGLLPLPMGKQNWVLALIATLPLLLPLRGILTGQIRSMTWGGYLLVVYFAIAVMESWSNPAERSPALIQAWLCILYFSTLVLLTQGLRRAK